MAKKSKLTQVAVKIGAAMGRADRKAHQIARAGVLAKKELADISKQVDSLKRQLQETTKRRNAPSPKPIGSVSDGAPANCVK